MAGRLVELSSVERSAHVLFEPLETAWPPGGVGVLFEVVAAGFVGVAREVWLAAEDCRAFASAIEQLARGQAERAELRSRNPGELALSLEAAGGSVVARVAMRKLTTVAGAPCAHALTTAFEVDAEALEAAAEDLRALISGE